MPKCKRRPLVLLIAVTALVAAGLSAAASARDVVDPTFNMYFGGNGTGSVTVSPVNLTCSQNCHTTIPSGTTVTIKATPSPDSAIDNWSGTKCQEQASNNTYNGSTCTFVFTGQAAQVNFRTDTVNAYIGGNGTGTIAANPPGVPAPGISGCKQNCHANYAPGTKITFTATPDPGSVIANWSSTKCQEQGSAQTYNGPTCTITEDRSSVQVNFATATLIVYFGGNGKGSVSASPAGLPAPGISGCTTSCRANYAPGTTVKLTATPAAGSHIDNWSSTKCQEQGSALQYSGGTCTFVFTGQAAQVNFALGAAPAGGGAPTIGSTTVPAPPPVAGKAVDVEVDSGTVLVKTPGRPFRKLVGQAQVPVGSIVDATKGNMGLASSGGQSNFSKGAFVVKQPLIARGKRVTDVALTGGNLAACPVVKKTKRRPASVAATPKLKPTSIVRKLFGNGKGSFRTSGKFAAATVRGTIWQIYDRCDGTLTHVTRGVVAVNDRKRHKTVIVTAGHSYLAKR